ncbi:MAG TPA: hypothetical protein VG295_15905 [Solirubrobacteraceae bacterium]|jgi:hypothetical protein|nr:hypothetical protein [Solirubrobacteraceae bacterium]
MRKILLFSVVVVSVAAASIAWAETTPSVVTGDATSVSNSTAVVHGTVNPGGGSTAFSFQYGPTAPQYGLVSRTGKVSGTSAHAVTRTLTGLTPGTTYHYAIQAVNRAGATIGRDRTFTTTGHPPPGATTGVAVAVTNNAATLTGAVVTNEQTTSAYFQWGTTLAYGIQTNAVNVTASATPQPVSFTLVGLAAGTTYHYRLVASHPGVAPQVGADVGFTTIPLVRFHDRVTAHTTPGRARHKPYLFTTTGTVIPAVAFPPGVACTGVVNVRFFSGRKAVAFRRAALQSNCSYGTQVGFRHLVKHHKSVLRVVVRFTGNAYLRPADARTRRVTLG